MPAIHLFHRRTLLGGDDLQPAAFLIICLRLAQLTLLLGPIVAHISYESRQDGSFWAFVLFDPNDEPECRNAHLFGMLLVSYVAASTVYGLASIALEWRISHWSSQGSPVEIEPRSSKVAQLLELKMVPFSIVLFLVWVTGIASLGVAKHYNRCEEYRNNNLQNQPDNGTEYSTTAGIRLWWVAMGFLLLTQFSEVLVGWILLLRHCQQPKEDASMTWEQTGEFSPAMSHELIEEMWADRCAAACHCLGMISCFAFGGREVLLGRAAFGDVARALADYLEHRGVLDVVPSDIAVGFIVLQRLQRERLHRARAEVLTDLEQNGTRRHDDDTIGTNDALLIPLDTQAAEAQRQSLFRFDPDGGYERRSRAVLNRSNFVDMSALDEGARYSRFALAIYTWILYMYVHPITGVFRLASRSGCACCRAFASTGSVGTDDERERLANNLLPDDGHITGDNVCQTHKSALLLTAGLRDADLVYAQLKSGFRENPYCILLDHEWRTVVLSVRGTFSLEDCVTDVLVDPQSLEGLGREFGFDATGQYCHGGVLTCVRNVYRDLQRHQLLDRLLLGDNARYKDYSLRLVGHSLGAATCTILSYMLRPKFPNLRCVNYSPPGCSLTWEMATQCKEWCSSFVLDSDLVPRLSLDSMDLLRDEILSLIGRIKVPKIEVVQRLVNGSNGSRWNFFTDLTQDDADPEGPSIAELLHRPGEEPESAYQQQLQRFQAIQAERRQARGASRAVRLFPPGKMIHLVKTSTEKKCLHGIAKCLTCYTTNYGFVYTPIWINNDDLNEIIVNPHMGTDHFPNRMASVIASVAADFGLKS